MKKHLVEKILHFELQLMVQIKKTWEFSYTHKTIR